MPEGAKLLGIKWVSKPSMNELQEGFKQEGRLLAKGSEQISDVHYFGTFATKHSRKSEMHT